MLIETFRVVSILSNLFESSGSQRESKFFDNNNKIDRFNFDNIDYFNSFYESKSVNTILIIKYFDKNIFFRNIHIFVNRVKNVIKIKNDILIQ